MWFIEKFKLIYKTMLLYCLNGRKNSESKNLQITKTNKGRAMLLSKCSVYNGKKSKFIKEQEAEELLSKIGKTWQVTWPVTPSGGKREQRKKRKSFKGETIKRLSSSKCFRFSHSRVSRIPKVSLWADNNYQYSMAPLLCQPWVINTVINKNCFNVNVSFQICTIIIDSHKKTKKESFK